MHIKELVLENFKSFGRKTRIPFYEDFTVVTGPNGSGKSNIIDAVLFALGLARTRGIRAEKLTDLIYNPGHAGGDDGGGPKEAIVEVVLANDDGKLTRAQVENAAGSEDVGDVDEIAVKRRVKRTEDNYYSYYYLNGRAVNLSDIQDLLAQAGVAPEGYNVVMQGDVTEIINMTPHARREIVDEIAGVAEFDAKKADALEELEIVKERIEEAEIRIDDKHDRLDQLADERREALRYLRLRREKEEYEGYLKAAELEDKREALDDVLDRIEGKRDELADLERELDERQGKVIRLEDDLEELNREIERKGEDEQLQIKSDINSIQNDIELLEEKVSGSEDAIESADADRRQAFVQVDKKQEEIEDLEDEIRECKVEKSSLMADVQDKRAALADLQAEVDAIDTEYDELKTELQERKRAVEAARDEKNELQREQDRLLDEARRRSNEIGEVEDDVEAAEAEIPELEAEREDLEDELEKARENARSIEGVVDDLKREKQDVQGEIEDVEDELQRKQQEYAELEANAEASGDSSYGRSVTTILNSGIGGVHGTVAQLGSVGGEYAQACETAAGGRMANVVVDDDVVGQQCIDHLKSRNAGRATFLPMTDMHDRSLSSPPDLPGVVDFAYNLLDFGEEYTGIFSYVVGDTLVVEDLETARDLQGDYRLVTLDGDLVEKSGAMTGGSSSGSRYSFAKSGRGELERVAQQITELQEQREALREELRDVDERLDDARDRKTEATDAVRDVQRDVDAVTEEIESTRERVERLEARKAELADEREDVDAEMQKIEAEVAAKQEEIAGIEDDIEELEGELADSRVPELTAEMEDIEAEIDDLEARVSDIDGSLNDLTLQKEYAEDAIEDLHDDIEDAQERKAEHEEQIADLEDDIAEKEDVL